MARNDWHYVWKVCSAASLCCSCSSRNPPQPVAHASPPAVAQGRNGTMVGGVGAAVADGSAVAHKAVDAVLGPRVC
ncbi:hypothetical protein Q3G72_019643 [Acer saccharum]|nr:hypothetical protein Q3G72_019643 [Acer saccharum]